MSLSICSYSGEKTKKFDQWEKLKQDEPSGKLETIIVIWDIFMFIKCETACSRVRLVKSIWLTVKIRSATNNPTWCATLFDWISQMNKPNLFPPAKRIPMFDVSVEKESKRLPGLEKTKDFGRDEQVKTSKSNLGRRKFFFSMWFGRENFKSISFLSLGNSLGLAKRTRRSLLLSISFWASAKDNRSTVVSFISNEKIFNPMD